MADLSRCSRCGQTTKRTIKQGHGKGKGAEFEGWCCKLFEKWWSVSKFVRTKNMQVVGTSYRLAHGDIVSVVGTSPLVLDPYFPFSIECKKDETWTFLDFFKADGRANAIEVWWKQCREDAIRWNKHPLLVFSKNYFPIMTATLADVPIPYGVQGTGVKTRRTYVDLLGDSLCIMPLEDFFASLKRREDVIL